MAAAVNPEHLLRELHSLWTDLGREAEREASPGVLRACALTLIVVTEDSTGVAETLAELMREHPCRAIVISTRPEAAALEARVTAQCWLPLGQKRQICSEQIEITSGRSNLTRVIPPLNTLTAADLPVVVWGRDSAFILSQQMQPILPLADRLISDSWQTDAPGEFLRRLVQISESGLRVGDLAWARLTCWRETVAQLFEAQTCLQRCGSISEIQVSWAGQAARSEIWYIAAWLAEALGWEPGDPRVRVAHVRDAGDGRLLRAQLTAPGMRIAVDRAVGGKVTVSLNGMLHETLFPERSESSVLAEELSVVEPDAVYERVLPVAARLSELGLE